MAAKSIPILKYDFVLIANCNLVPTPSVLETSKGSFKPVFFKSNNPPKPPNFALVPFIEVASVIEEISETSLLPSSISTPESL